MKISKVHLEGIHKSKNMIGWITKMTILENPTKISVT